MKRRVVVTGMGVVTALGNTVDGLWDNVLQGRSGVSPITSFDTRAYDTHIAAEVKDWDAELWMERKEARRIDRYVQFAVAAAKQALAMAQWTHFAQPDRVGVCIGSGIGGLGTWEEQHAVLLTKGPRRVSPFFIPMMIANMATGHVSIVTGAKGPNTTAVTACASGAHSIGEAARLIEHGYADAMICGGAEATIRPTGIGGFCAMRALSTRNDAPQAASRPFDRDRDGFVMGEGAGVLVIESLDHARARGARVYAEIAGFGMSADAHHMTDPDPDGAARCMQHALDDAGVSPHDIQYINAHGTSTAAGDASETKAIKQAFGAHAYALAVSSTKSMTGHLLGAAGGVEAILCVLALQHQVIPPTINLDTPDEACDLDFVPHRARPCALHTVMSNSFGFGGHNASIVLRRAE
ncbi:MAG: beta-ketoacyl-ACP synthase II [Paenibacillaceae bacterium]|nr:beta-ketoacyl-ACP synthase II [Paenibacillaceae bacterium]